MRSTEWAISPMSCPIWITDGAELRLNPAQRVDHLPLDDDVEGAGRLVGDDDLGLQADRDGDADALLHAAAQLVRVHLGHLRRQADPFEQAGDVIARAPRRSARRRGRATRARSARVTRLTGLSEFIAPWATREMLGQARPSHLPPRSSVQQIDAVEQDLAVFDPARGFDQAKQAEGDRRLAAARLADETEPLARFAGRSRRRRPPSPARPACGSRRAGSRRAVLRPSGRLPPRRSGSPLRCVAITRSRVVTASPRRGHSHSPGANPVPAPPGR